MLPRFEDETQCVHVAVRTDARITEKVPGAAKLFAALDEGEAMVGAIHLQMHGHADTRNARTDDQHILIDRCSLCVHGAFHRRRACHRLSPIYLWAQLTHRVAFCNRIDSLESKRSEEHTSELQSLMRISYAVFCLKKKHNTSSYNRQSIY